MKQAVLAQFDLPWIPLTGLVLFVACFALYCFWTFKRSNLPLYTRAAELPLEDIPRARSAQKGDHE